MLSHGSSETGSLVLFETPSSGGEVGPCDTQMIQEVRGALKALGDVEFEALGEGMICLLLDSERDYYSEVISARRFESIWRSVRIRPACSSEAARLFHSLGSVRWS